jgi:hypothetical protein
MAQDSTRSSMSPQGHGRRASRQSAGDLRQDGCLLASPRETRGPEELSSSGPHPFRRRPRRYLLPHPQPGGKPHLNRGIRGGRFSPAKGGRLCPSARPHPRRRLIPGRTCRWGWDHAGDGVRFFFQRAGKRSGISLNRTGPRARRGKTSARYSRGFTSASSQQPRRV